jgi:hypothetical protein
MSLRQAWQEQIAACERMGSPLTARVLEAAWADRERGGALAQLLPSWRGDASADAVPLRVAGALHAMALDGSDVALAALYAAPPGRVDAPALLAAVGAALQSQPDRVADYLRTAPQTNEIGRSAVLLGGFATIARETGLPLATLEIGASAGLNGLWPRCRYQLGGTLAWGDAASPVQIRSLWRGPHPAWPVHLHAATHAACDAAPIDLRADGAALRLIAYVWPDQRERVERTRAAIAMAMQRDDLRVEAADALPWAERELAAPRRGFATVLYHSVVWQYLRPATRDGLRECIAAAGARATPDAPLAWLAFEPPAAPPAPSGSNAFELSLTVWPIGLRRVLATAHSHGAEVDWH